MSEEVKQDIVKETWQSIREKDIRALYERTKAHGGYNGPFEPFRRYVTQADLGGPYVDAPSELDIVKELPDDFKTGIWLAFE